MTSINKNPCDINYTRGHGFEQGRAAVCQLRLDIRIAMYHQVDELSFRIVFVRPIAQKAKHRPIIWPFAVRVFVDGFGKLGPELLFVCKSAERICSQRRKGHRVSQVVPQSPAAMTCAKTAREA